MALYATLVVAIDSYTGLSPTAFFTLLVLMVGVYRLVSGMFVAPATGPPRAGPAAYVAPPPPVQIGDVTLDELRAYDGSDPSKPLLMAIKGQIYDVSRSRMFYGPGGPYALFAGRDASRALALMSFDENDLTGDLEGLGPAELDALQDWEFKFTEKYVKVGQIAAAKPAAPPSPPPPAEAMTDE
ncbi:membrane steroid-binding protein 1-like [Wolffia australiana]